MTQDFKDQLLDYLTGNLDVENPTNTLNYQATETITNNLDTYIRNEISQNYYITGLLQSKTNENILIKITGVDSKRDYFVITDNTLTPIAFISQFTSGVDFRRFMCIDVDEDGYFYAIESDTTKTTSGNKDYYPNKRFLMLNNITTANASGNYTVKIRKSYAITSSTQLYYAETITKVNKSVGRSLYAFFYLELINNSASYYTTKLTVNVGSSNEWTDKSLQTYTGAAYGNGRKLYINFDSNDNIIINDIFVSQNDIYIYSYKNNTETLTTKANNYVGSDWIARTDDKGFKSNIYAYLVFETGYSDRIQLTILMINLETNEITEIYNVVNNNYSYNVGNLINVFSYESEVFLSVLFCNDSVNKTFELQVGRIVNDQIYFNTLDDNIAQTDATIGVFLVTKNFNLYRYYIRNLPNSLISCKEIYNSSGYNGTEYSDVNSLVPEISAIYSSGDLVYARTLYNKQINGNMTISTIEIPNNYLNDITLQPKNLYGETNLLLNSDTAQFTKNIYETVNLNFLNTISIINTDTSIINNLGAIRINNSISQNADYQNAYLGKIRINYTDNTSEVKNVQLPVISSGVATYNMAIYVPKTITNIEMISNDGNTVYNTITGTFDVGKYYVISQEVTIE